MVEYNKKSSCIIEKNFVSLNYLKFELFITGEIKMNNTISNDYIYKSTVFILGELVSFNDMLNDENKYNNYVLINDDLIFTTEEILNLIKEHRNKFNDDDFLLYKIHYYIESPVPEFSKEWESDIDYESIIELKKNNNQLKTIVVNTCNNTTFQDIDLFNKFYINN